MIKNKIQKYIDCYKFGGITELINRFLGKLKIKYKLKTQIERKKDYFLKLIMKISDCKVMEGPYKNTKLQIKSHWNNYDFSSKLLGTYERHIQDKIVDLKNKNNLQVIINIGAGEGYHIVSLIKNNFFNKGLAFEIDKFGQKLINENLKLNNIDDSIKIFGEGNLDNLIKNTEKKENSKTLFLIDIEGEEFQLLNSEFFEFFKESIFIIELHEFAEKNKKKISNFFDAIQKNFNYNYIENYQKNPFKIKELDQISDDVRMLAISENRPLKMNWIFLEPK